MSSGGPVQRRLGGAGQEQRQTFPFADRGVQFAVPPSPICRISGRSIRHGGLIPRLACDPVVLHPETRLEYPRDSTVRRARETILSDPKCFRCDLARRSGTAADYAGVCSVRQAPGSEQLTCESAA